MGPKPCSIRRASPRVCAAPSTISLAGQSQKEGYVNELAGRIDALLNTVVEAQLDTPPASPAEGKCWLVGPSPTGAWAAHGGELAAREAGNWLFAPPVDGMRVIDRATGQQRHYLGGWKAAARPAEPSGGTTIDAEARGVIAALILSLAEAGVLPTP